MDNDLIIGRNPVTEALKSGRTVEKLMVAKGSEKSLSKLIAMAKDAGVPVYYNDKSRMDKIAGGGAHQGVAASCAAVSYVEVEDILKRAEDKGEAPFLVVCESIQDPHNLGAILRTAECAGVHGVIISKHSAVGLTDVVAKTAAGALEYVPVAKVSSVAKLVDDLKKRGIWTACADMDGTSIYQTDLKGPLALIIGGEHEGITRLVKERCDFVVSLPMKGHVTSLNASVAAGILMYEAAHQRDL